MGADGELATLLMAARQLVDVGLRERIEREPVNTESKAFLDYLIMRFSGRSNEQLIGWFLDRQEGYIAERILAVGSGDSLNIHPRTLFKEAIGLDCA
ncbi:JAB domain-containing protein [Novosphingobium aquiterrae]|uniref:JAB domain-containing protein n=1 Tax=Novosphingobium aquiterrae TaxID=624388 RepID=A0ABV6PL11_9SPHN